jgi:photosystem II stability/assembly factor-like uncharacterized protein
VPLSYVKQAILFPRLICLASIFILFSSPVHALETIFISGYKSGEGTSANSVILKTTDGGNLWTASNIDTRVVTSVVALDSTNYFAVGGVSGANTGFTFTNNSEQSVASGLLQSVDAVPGTYYAAGNTADGSSGTILKSTDGTTWTTQVSSGPKLYGISALDANVVYAVGASGTVQKTTDGGTNWSSQTTDSSDYVLYGVDAVNSTTAYAVGKNGSDGVILKKTNETSWTTTQTISGIPLNAVSVTPDDPNVAFAVGDGSAILKTTDGSTWLDSGYSGNGGALSSIYAVSSTKAYAVGLVGSFARLDSSGWVDISATIPTAYRSYNFTGVSVFVTVPEPSTIILSVVAVSVLAIIQRTRRNAPNHA